MASKIDFSGLTLNTEEARDTSELVFEKLYVRPELKDVHEVKTGIKMDKFIPILGQFGLVGKVDPGSCGVNTETGQIPVSHKTWTPKRVSFRMIHCQDDLPDKLKFWAKLAGIPVHDLWENIDTNLKSFLVDAIIDATMQSILRISSFGDTTLSPVGDGTGNQLLTAGTTKTYFNMLNGLWKQIFSDQAGSALTKRYEIPENNAGSKEEQDNLKEDRALQIFRYMYNKIDPRAHDTNLVFQITRSIFNNWQDFLEDKSLAFMLTRAEEGATKWNYRGIPVIIRQDWERLIRTYHDLGDTYYLPHRAILTDINNIPIGTPDEESMDFVDAFYDKVTKSHYFDVAYGLDIKLLLEYELACAY